ncbi:hypothetical protein IAR55_002239 [Kwoniella newhampshirensis]|uniref:Fe2OG dioxygenase domain-containing protein n=1 Tax=Kwoniella newhampshirensis TaxID=1651941 RepID=A0AAW0Z0S2_9TREE
MSDTVAHFLCLDRLFIPPVLEELFRCRQEAGGRGARHSLLAAKVYEDQAVVILREAIRSDISQRKLHLRFMRLSTILPGEAFDDIDPPEWDEIDMTTCLGLGLEEEEVRFRVHTLWLLFDGRMREARECVLTRARQLVEQKVIAIAQAQAEHERNVAIKLQQQQEKVDDGCDASEVTEEEKEEIEWERVGGTPRQQDDETSVGTVIVIDKKGRKHQPFAGSGSELESGSSKKRTGIDSTVDAQVTPLKRSKQGVEDGLSMKGSTKRSRRSKSTGVMTAKSSPPEGKGGKRSLDSAPLNFLPDETTPLSQAGLSRLDGRRAKSQSETKIETKTKSTPTLNKARKDQRQVKTDYSGGWSICRAPDNIMSLLRFDHPPEILNAPQPPRGPKPDFAEVGSRLAGAVGRQTPRGRRAIMKRAARLGVAKEADDRPPSGGLNRPGIRSSTFCAVLRIIAGIAPPIAPQPSTTIQKPSSRPPVWAESRQELCEALPYYRSFQSGLYMHDRVAFGYLLEAFPAPRDTWAHNGRIVISHGGGQCIRKVNLDGTPGPTTLQADQSSSDARVETLLTAHHKRTPIILIAGAGYEFLPWKLECAYVVLGWYWISAAWVEAESAGRGVTPPPGRNYFHRYKIRFDWVDSQGEPWWDRKVISGFGTGSKEGSPLIPCPEDSDSFCRTLPTTTSFGSSSPKPGTKLLYQEQHHFLDDLSQDSEPLREVPSEDLPSASHPRAPIMDVRFILNSTGLMTPPITPPEPDAGASLPIHETESPQVVKTEGVDFIPLNDRTLPGEGVLNHESPVASSQDLEERPFSTVTFDCPTCFTPNYHVYQESQICLSPDCPAFFMLPTSLGLLPIPPGFHFTLSQDFLTPCKSPNSVRRLPYSVVPPEPVSRSPDADNEGVGGRTLWRGWVCRKCGRANSRYRWEVWECRNCGNTLRPLDPNRVVFTPSLEATPPPFLGNAHLHVDQGINSNLMKIDYPSATVIIYDIIDVGKVYHVMHNQFELANELLDRYQREAARGGWFQRRALKTNAIKGPMLAQHFALNSGASYKYNVDVVSLSFEDSPSCVIHALDLITKRVESVLREKVPFNECLSVMYREGQKMSWHDDGERGLGPVVASLSLGSPAIMSFRRKQARVEPNQGYYIGRATASARVSPPVALSITLSHGDIMIMQGREIQKRFDHRVIPQGFRIAATARTIGVA